MHNRSGEINREIKYELYGSARNAIGTLTPGCNVFGFCKGEYSLVDLVSECIRQIGSEDTDATFCTWTAAKRDITHVYEFVEHTKLKSVRWLVDRSFPQRQPEMCEWLAHKFGPDNMRVTNTHAKFVLLRNADWNLCLRTSMNLNQNRRLENWEISDCAKMADFLQDLVDTIWDVQDYDSWQVSTIHNSQFTGLDLVDGKWTIKGDSTKKKKRGFVVNQNPVLL